MYWIYLTLFIFIILTPQIIREGVWLFREEDVEALIIFCFGLLGFILYLAKEKALLRVFQEKLHLQKRTNTITKDLSDSYSYIGEMNRKFDIMKELIFQLPQVTAQRLVRGKPETFYSLLEAVKLLAKTEAVSLRFVNTRTHSLEKVIEVGAAKEFADFSAEALLASRKTFWEEQVYACVRSPLPADRVHAYLVFAKSSNHIENIEVFKILAAQATLLYTVDRYAHQEAAPPLDED